MITREKPTENTRSPTSEFFEHLSRELVRLITERTELGSVYRMDLRLRPEGDAVRS